MAKTCGRSAGTTIPKVKRGVEKFALAGGWWLVAGGWWLVAAVRSQGELGGSRARESEGGLGMRKVCVSSQVKRYSPGGT